MWNLFLAAIKLLVGAVMAGLGGYAKGKKAAEEADAAAEREAEAEAAKRIEHADVGIGATDLGNIDWLHDFARKHGKPLGQPLAKPRH